MVCRVMLIIFAKGWYLRKMWYRRPLRRRRAAQWPRTKKTAGAVFRTYHFFGRRSGVAVPALRERPG